MKTNVARGIALGALCACSLGAAAIAGAAGSNPGWPMNSAGVRQAGIPYYSMITSRRRSGPTFIVRPYGVPQYVSGPIGPDVIVGPTWMYRRVWQ